MNVYLKSNKKYIKQRESDHTNLIKKFYPNGCSLITLKNPTFRDNETYESFIDKNKINIK